MKNTHRVFLVIAMLAVAGSLFFLIRNYFKNFTFESGFELAAIVEEIRQNESTASSVQMQSALKVPIFIYHSVRPHISRESKWQDAYDITPELLERQLAYIKEHGYTTITLDDLMRDFESGTTSPVTKPVILTFDDGWENQYKYAFPLLKKYNAVAVFYIFTNPISKKQHFLTWDQIAEMDSAGMTIASHTLTHPYLQKLTKAQLKIEFLKSKQILEDHLGHPILHFASPFGFSNISIEALLKEAGYRTGRTTYKGIYQDNPMRLLGVLVDDNFDDFVKALK